MGALPPEILMHFVSVGIINIIIIFTYFAHGKRVSLNRTLSTVPRMEGLGLNCVQLHELRVKVSPRAFNGYRYF